MRDYLDVSIRMDEIRMPWSLCDANDLAETDVHGMDGMSFRFGARAQRFPDCLPGH